MGAKRLGYGGETTREETTRGGTPWLRNVLLPTALVTVGINRIY